MTLQVWIEDRPVGRLEKFGRGTSFTYNAGVKPTDAISLTMPVRITSYNCSYGLLPIFDTNLPEGALLERITAGLRKARGSVDEIDVLELTGGNQIGRIRVLPEGEVPERRTSIDDINEILEQQASRTLVNEIMTRYAVRSGVSGAMPKVLVDTESTDSSQGSTRQTIQTRDYILKFDAEDFPGLSLNEYHCMRAAWRAGVHRVAQTKLNVDGRMLSVRRFDHHDGHRTGFEDLASLNAKTSRDKYSGSIETDLFKRVREFSGATEKENLEALYRLCVINIALRNGDAHLKNFAMLYEDTTAGPIQLAPAYDLVTTTVYIEADMMALSLGGSKRWPKPATVLQLGARAGLSRQQAGQIMEDVATGLRLQMPEMLKDFKARGQDALGQKMVAAWNQGLTQSLGVKPCDIENLNPDPDIPDI